MESNARPNRDKFPKGRGRGRGRGHGQGQEQELYVATTSKYSTPTQSTEAYDSSLEFSSSNSPVNFSTASISSTSMSAPSPSPSGSIADSRPALPSRFIGRGRCVIPDRLRATPLEPGEDPFTFRPIVSNSPLPSSTSSSSSSSSSSSYLLPNPEAHSSSFLSSELSAAAQESIQQLRRCNETAVSSSLPQLLSNLNIINPIQEKCSSSTSYANSQSQFQNQQPHNIQSHTSKFSPSLPTTTSSSSDPEIQMQPVIKQGQKGKPLNVTCNYLRLTVEKDKGYFEYHANFEPNITHFPLRKQIINSHAEFLGPARSFDGTILYLGTKLPYETTRLSSRHKISQDQNQRLRKTKSQDEETDSETEVIVTLKYRKHSPLNKNCVTFYNILFRRFMHILGMVEMGKNYFDPNKTYMIPQHRLEIWPGLITSVDNCEGGLLLTCDTSFRVLSTLTMLDLLNEIKSNCNQNPNPNYKDLFAQAILGKVILTRYNNRSYRIDDIAWDQTPLSTFSISGQLLTFQQYFLQKYCITIEDLSQPLLISRPTKTQNSPAFNSQVICLIPELCYNTGLTDELRSSFTTMKDISSYTRLPPYKRQASIKTFIQNLRSNEEIQRILKLWGLTVEDSPLQLQARQIQPPNLNINPDLCLKLAPSDFASVVMSNPVMNPVTVEHWAIICLPQDCEKARRFASSYRQACIPLGIQVTADAEIITLRASGGNLVESYRKCIAEKIMTSDSIQFLVVILPGRRQDLYGYLKRLVIVEDTGKKSNLSPREVLATQMVLASTLSSEKKLRAVVTKIALQINCKLGGYLWSLQIPLVERIMFVGIDVYHDPRRIQKGASCLALVASMNGEHTKFFSRVVFQRSGQETGDSIGSAFGQALTAFYDDNRAFPQRIVVFRDGVGDGQLELVREHEAAQFLRVMDFMMGEEIGNKAKFTFAVIQKRINTRIAVSAEDGKGSGLRNPPGGTIVDHTVTRRFLFDFFMVSQYVRDGTATPTHIVVVEDNCNVSPDLMQKFAFVTTFMYYNWPGTIRVPAVCQYAHKLAYLVGEHLDGRVPSERLAKFLYFL